MVWALSLSLATTQEIIIIFSSSAYLDVSVRQVCALQYTFSILGFPIQKSADHVIFANPRSLSQLITSFIASESQGIPRVPFLTFFYHIRFCSDRYAFLVLPILLLIQESPTVVFSFNYFFQYVKELLFPSVA
jgi:hypothetical protein